MRVLLIRVLGLLHGVTTKSTNGSNTLTSIILHNVRIAWRQLNIELTASDIQTIEAFIIKTLGKSFELNV